MKRINSDSAPKVLLTYSINALKEWEWNFGNLQHHTNDLKP